MPLGDFFGKNHASSQDGLLSAGLDVPLVVGGLSGHQARKATDAMNTALAHQDAHVIGGAPRLLGSRRHDVGSFLKVGKGLDSIHSSDAIGDFASTARRTGSKKELGDFLFGDASLQLENSSSSSSKGSFLDFNSLKPTMSMMSGATIATTVESLCDMLSKNPVCKFLDITESHKDEDLFEQGGAKDKISGWSKVVPRGIRMTMVWDMLSLATLLLSKGTMCDQPLRAWLIGGILLGLPTTWLVNKVAKCQPDYQYYRVIVLKTRGGGKEDKANFKLKGVRLFDRMGAQIKDDDVPGIVQRPDLNTWIIEMPERTLITGYQLVTHGTADEKDDPAAWRFQGSYDGVHWEMVDEEKKPQMPRGRGVPYERLEELMHLEDSAAVFRASFALEVLANIASFAWLVTGTSWVTLGADECVDGAPLLFYYCYVVVVLCWSLLGTATFGLIVSAVAMVVLGMKAPSQPRNNP